ncbi:hypothetical protein ACFYP4_02865 [Streptomyces sp. NPDC005551]|uniref:hypothetical protein n=1 Tax=Streptomyces sp. NPDC005551 TaxID=3364725 RepID=UPI00369A4F39
MASRNLSSGQFPQMGESAVAVTYRSAEPGQLVPRKRGKEVPEPRTAVPRTQVHANHGYANGGVKVYRTYINEAASGATGRNVKPIGASHNGRAEFDSRRCYGQST